MSRPCANIRSRRNVSRRRPRSDGAWSALSVCALLLCTSAILADEEPQPDSSPEYLGTGGREASSEATRQQAIGTATQTRLDEVDAEKAAMRLQLELLNRKQADLEAEAAQVEPLKRRLSESQTAAERAASGAEALRAEIAQLKQQRQSEAEKHTAQLTAAELRLREHKDRAGGLDAQIQRLERQLAQREERIERLEAAEARRVDAKRQLENRLEELRARLPAPEGGTVTAAQARAQARADAETLQRLIREGQGVKNPQLWQQIRETENALHRNQYLLARAEGDRTVYRVRPGDSLALISAMVYGTDQAWQEIFEANRHLLDEPDRVLPGLTLVIP